MIVATNNAFGVELCKACGGISVVGYFSPGSEKVARIVIPTDVVIESLLRKKSVDKRKSERTEEFQLDYKDKVDGSSLRIRTSNPCNGIWDYKMTSLYFRPKTCGCDLITVRAEEIEREFLKIVLC